MSRNEGLFAYALILVALLVGCDGGPTAPDDDQTDQTNAVQVTVINNINGNDGCQFNCGKDGVEPDTGQNSPPTLALPSTITSKVGESVTADIVASDPDGDAVRISFDAQSAPRNCTIAPTGPRTARISCVISSSSPGDSPYAVRVSGDDGNGGVTTGVFAWIVPEPA